MPDIRGRPPEGGPNGQAYEGRKEMERVDLVIMSKRSYRGLKRENQWLRRVGIEIAHDRRFWVGAAFTLAVLLAVATTLLALTWGGVIVI